MAPRNPSVDLERFWLTGTAEEPELELVNGQLRPIVREELPPTPRQQRRRQSHIVPLLAELTWD